MSTLASLLASLALALFPAAGVPPHPQDSDSIDEDRVWLRGTLTCVDGEGVEHTEVNGVLWTDLTVRGGAAEDPGIEIVGGRFEFEVDRGAFLSIYSVEAEGRPVEFEEWVKVHVTEDMTIELRGSWPRQLKLHVLDEVTGQELETVTVVSPSETQREGFDGLAPYPGVFSEEDLVVQGAAAPLVLEYGDVERQPFSRPNNVFVWIGAPGYAWQVLPLNFTVGNERFIRLQPGADLEVITLGLPEDSGSSMTPRLVVRAASFAPDLDEILALIEAAPLEQFPEGRRPTRAEVEAEIAQVPGDPGTPMKGPLLATRTLHDTLPVRFSGLPVGDHLVEIVLGDPSREDHVVLSSRSVLLRSETPALLTLEVEDLPRRTASVPVGGTLYISPAWDTALSTATLEAIRVPTVNLMVGGVFNFVELLPQPDRPGWYSWKSEVFPGDYKFVLEELNFEGLVRVPETGQPHARLVVGDPVEVVVEALDPHSGWMSDLPQLCWYGERVEGAQGGSLESVNCDLDGLFRFRAPLGRLTLHLWDPDFEMFEVTHDLHAGENVIRIQVARATGVILRLRHEGRLLSIASAFGFVDLIGISGARRVSAGNFQGTGFRFGTTPGEFELRVRAFNGYRASSPERIVVPQGEYVEHIVDLERDR